MLTVSAVIAESNCCLLILSAFVSLVVVVSRTDLFVTKVVWSDFVTVSVTVLLASNWVVTLSVVPVKLLLKLVEKANCFTSVATTVSTRWLVILNIFCSEVLLVSRTALSAVIVVKSLSDCNSLNVLK